MEIVQIEFDKNTGLSFFKNENGKKTKIWETNIGTLNQMSLSDLEYCISTNVLIELDGLQKIFEDYLFGKKGEIEPKKSRDEPR